MNRSILFLFLLLTIFKIRVDAQSMENWISANEKIPAEKIYLQTDAENYFLNDTLWFKVYITDSRSSQLIPRAENVYVRLVDGSRNVIIQSVLLSSNGQASGFFALSDKIKPGNCLLQAYTNYLFNFGQDAFFYKHLSISRVSGNELNSGSTDKNSGMIAAVDFMPEGGVILENTTNLVAFKALNKHGYGVEAKGVIKDEKGTVITSFSTDYRGMGLLFLTPQAGKSYFATIEGFPSFKYRFEPVKTGVKIQLVNHTSKEVIINVAGNSETISGHTYYLASMYRGEVVFYQAFQMEGVNKVFKFDSNALKPGINKLVLLDEKFVPVSERLLFSKSSGINNLQVKSNSDIYGKRSSVSLNIKDEKLLYEKDFSQLSVAVVNEKVIPEGGVSKNILSHLLVDSELNGFIESSADLFNDNGLSSDAKLRLVMLTNGFSGYFWNYAPGNQSEVKFRQEAGINLKGVAKNLITGNNIENGEITMAIQKDDEVGFLSQKTDQFGNFSFKGLVFTDTAKVHVQARSESGKMNTDILLDPVIKDAMISEAHQKAINEKTTAPNELSALKNRIVNENRKFLPKIKQVRNKANASDSGMESNFKLYKTADYVLEVEEFEQSYNNIIDYMTGKVAGVDINGNDIRIRGIGTPNSGALPLFLIDGIPLVENKAFNLPNEITRDTDEQGNPVQNSQLVQTVKSIPISDIEKVEVLKSAQNLSMFGTKGSNGVIAIYTRRGKQNTGKTGTAGVIEKSVAGYAPFHSFYSPIYTPDNISDKKPDLRILMYWNPFVTTKNGTAELNFFTSDLPGNYRVVVEGIANDGRICIGSSTFEVK